MDVKEVGDLALLIILVTLWVLFIKVNVSYLPYEEDIDQKDEQ